MAPAAAPKPPPAYSRGFSRGVAARREDPVRFSSRGRALLPVLSSDDWEMGEKRGDYSEEDEEADEDVIDDDDFLGEDDDEVVVEGAGADDEEFVREWLVDARGR